MCGPQRSLTAAILSWERLLHTHPKKNNQAFVMCESNFVLHKKQNKYYGRAHSDRQALVGAGGCRWAQACAGVCRCVRACAGLCWRVRVLLWAFACFYSLASAFVYYCIFYTLTLAQFSALYHTSSHLSTFWSTSKALNLKHINKKLKALTLLLSWNRSKTGLVIFWIWPVSKKVWPPLP